MPSGSVISRGSRSRPARSSTAYSVVCQVSALVRPSLIATVRAT
jgi:hypothetical protein